MNMLNVWPRPSSKENELININKVTANNIISIAMIIRIIFFLFKINPNIPIKNKNNDKFIVEVFLYDPLGTSNNSGLIILFSSDLKRHNKICSALLVTIEIKRNRLVILFIIH